jgi:DNA polymerase-3 subunit gamma/tau
LNGKKNIPREHQEKSQTKDDSFTQQNFGNSAFTQEELENAWFAFADQLKDRPRLHNMLKARKPEIKENHLLELQLENPLQKDSMKEIYHKLLHHLKKQLGNDSIEMNILIVKDEEVSQDTNKLYTLDDKFNFLAEKNKSLQKFKKDFDLDFDY